MIVRLSFVVVVAMGFGSVSSAIAVDQIHPRVPGFDRFYSVKPTQSADDDDEQPVPHDAVTGGRILLGELNCTSCHTINVASQARVSTKQAPVLDDAGSRMQVDWIRSYLANPHSVKPGTTMPDLIATLPESSKAEAVEALTHFLASTGKVIEGRSDPASAKKGEALFHSVGCRACHNATDENAADLATSVNLPDLDKKYTGPGLMAFLRDPLKSRPSGRMPAMGLTDDDYRHLSNFFIKGGRVTPNLKFELYRGSWNKLPDFSELPVVRRGTAAGFDLSVAEPPNGIGLRFTAHLHIAKAGEYEFIVGSDDGSKLRIGDDLVVDCDGIHPHQHVAGRKTLGIGFHKVVVEYFDGGGETSLEVDIAGQGLTRQPLSGFLFSEPVIPEPDPGKPTFSVDAELVAKGRTLFARIGCASCHSMTVDGRKIASELKAPQLAELRADAGCLAKNVPEKSPKFGLSDAQRHALALALKNPSAESPSETVHRTLATMNCYACHQRDKIGGVERVRDGSFQSLQKEMGDEGRLPPNLSGVGDKLQPDWLRHVLHNGSDERKNYMVTRMPKFGPKDVDPLIGLFADVDQKPVSMPDANFPEPDYRVKAAGRLMVGGQSLSCIKCHDFGPHPSTGVRAISLTTMNRRLRADWFYRYVLDPQAYRRGTRMPAAWPFGQTNVRDVLNADVNLQVQAVWRYLSDGDKAAVPAGLIREPIELKPQSEPVIYRNFIEGAGSRAIGVGYPEGVNLAFDANNMRLALIWHGAFIDASRHWTGRGQGFEAPLGDDILPLPDRVPFIVLDTPDREFPAEQGREIGYKFLGYRLDSDRRPVFRYSLSGLRVEDHPIPLRSPGKIATLTRTLRFNGTADSSQIWYRAAVAGKLELVKPGQYLIDGIWSMDVDCGESNLPKIRPSSGKQELLVPIRLKDGRATIKQSYHW